MFSLVCALPSPASAEGCPPLFGWFTGTTAQSDFSGTYMSAVRLVAFADRSWSFVQDVQEISRFSCMLFLSVRGFSDYAGPNRSEEHTSELQSLRHLVCRLLLEKKNREPRGYTTLMLSVSAEKSAKGSPPC